ncbi:MAG: DUF368 domain-containing protein [Clostridium sp.]|nr:DUF368 domain-containing protein [Clostridium sp.]MCM1444390.1 DUF368 domain-containing protein [Candidatus Amulumruptor caecigallinarius]
MLRTFLGGILIGVANIIPGISGGTMIVLLGIFDKTMNSISDFFKFKIDKKRRLEAFKFLVILVIGMGIGLVGFAKILTFLFENFENQTLMCFAGLILFSLPIVKNKEIKDNKISIIWFILGILVIGALTFLSPSNTNSNITLEELIANNFTLIYILQIFLLGFISGAATIFPGISGSMILLILGWYHIFKGYVANITSFNPQILIGLCIIAIGVLIGIIVSAKLTSSLLKKYKTNTMSFILGLILMSAITIIPLKGYDLVTTITSIITFIIGAIAITILGKKEKN